MKLVNNKETLSLYSEDFGRLVNGSPASIATPSSIEEIQDLVRYCRDNNLSITSRGLGRSQSGQSLGVSNSISLDLSSLKNIGSVDPEQRTLRCEAGVTWKEILQKTLPYSLIPPVMPLNLNLTIGGTLSVGGIGTTSHRDGIAAANVRAIEVIDATGRRVDCSDSDELFRASLTNLGRCAVIGSAEIELNKVKKNIRTFYLLYDDISAWIQDQTTLLESGNTDHLQGVCSSSIQGLKKGESMYNPFVHWFYGLQVSFSFDDFDELPSTESLLKNLHFYKMLHFEDDTISNFSHRFEARFEMLKKTGQEFQPHPWIECILPLEVISEVLPQVLKILPVWLGDGHRLIFLKNKRNPKFFKTPDSELNAVFAILPTGVSPVFVDDTLKILKRVHEMLVEAGGKRYLSGWLGMMDQLSWKNHYGRDFEEWQAAKKKFDPNLVFQSKLFNDLNF